MGSPQRMAGDDLPSPTFDLDIWASNYEGALLPLRLAHVAQRCPPLAKPSLTLAISAAKQGKNVQLYSRLFETAAAIHVDDLPALDKEWASRQDELNKRELVRLEGELRGYKNNLIRESIRMGQEDLAIHLLSTGGPPPDPSNAQSQTGYSAAYQAFGKMREYCTTPSHVASMTLRCLYTAVLQAVSAQQAGGSPATQFSAVLANASRLRTVGVKEEEQAKLAPISTAMTGLAHLMMGSYREAANDFVATPQDYVQLGPVHGTDFARAVASGNDLAICGGLCALATMSRDELAANVLSGSFRTFLELEPHMRKAISLYVTAKYQACLATLTHYATDWNLDVFLGAPTAQGGSHVNVLLARIRERSITAYFSSFSEVSLQSLAATFPPAPSSDSSPEATIAAEAKVMIESGVLNARLDPVNGVLVAPHVNSRASTIAAAADAAADVERTLLLRLNKVNMVMAGLEVTRGKPVEPGLAK